MTVRRARAVIRRLGRRWDGAVNAETLAAYLPLQRLADRSATRYVAEISYGPSPLQSLDLFVPDRPRGGLAPAVVYLHGGGMARGDKVSPGSDGLIYSNIPVFFARNGYVGINANYRLVPEARWPSGAGDVGAIIGWIRREGEQLGADPDSVFLLGNSSGAAHVAAYLFSPDLHVVEGGGVKGAILSSGVFTLEGTAAETAYYGPNLEMRRKRCPLGLLEAYAGRGVPLLFWSAEFDPEFVQHSVAEMYGKALEKLAIAPRLVSLAGHNHVSHVLSVNSTDDAVGRTMLDFLRAFGPAPAHRSHSAT